MIRKINGERHQTKRIFPVSLFRDFFQAGPSGIVCLGILSTMLIILTSLSQAYGTESPNSPELMSVAGKPLKTIIVADYYPYSFVNEKGMPDGFSVDIAKAVSAVMDMTSEITVDTWQNARQALANGNIDFLPMMAESAARRQSFDFSVPHTIAYDAVFVRKGSQRPRSSEDLAGKTVIVMNKDAAHDYLLSSGISDKIKLVLVDSLPDGLRLLASGQGDALLMPKLVGLILMKQLNITNVEESPLVIDAYSRPFSFAVKKGDKALQERLSQGLSIVKASGQYDQIYNKWFGALEPRGLPWISVLKYILAIVAGFSLIGLGLLLWSVSLKKQVALRTESLEAEIGERKKTEEALSESEQRYRRIVETANEGIWAMDRDFRTTFVNRHMAEMLGYAPAEMLGRTVHSFMFEEDLGDHQGRMNLRRQGQGDTYERRFVNKDGGTLWTVASATPLIDAEGRFDGSFAMFADITELKQAEEELRESEEKFSKVFHYAPVLITLSNMDDGTYLDVNQTFSEVSGFSRGEAIGRTSVDLGWISREDRMRLIEEMQAHGSVRGMDLKLLTKDKREIYCIYNGEFIQTKNLRLLLSIALDITERKRAERSLRESEESSRLLIEQAPIGIGIMQDGVLTQVNPQFLKVFGYDSMLEVLGLPVEEFYSPEDRSLITQRCKDRLLGKPLPVHYEVRGLKKNGESFDLEVWPTVVDYYGKPAILTFCADTTETKSLRSQLLQAQKMEAIGTLAGGVAHDFNNLLQVASGYSELLLNDKSPDHPDYDKLHTINATAKRGADLVKRLMVFSRKGDTKLRALDLNHEVTQIKKLLDRTIPKMIAIELSLQGDLPVINADPVQVEQILLNLAINAKDAMPESGGKLTIETRNVTLDEEYCRVHLEAKPGQYVMISVSDTGHGMTQETVQHIFEPFFTTKGVGKGTGLGLAMVYGIMKHHEGFINCYSEIGHGTTFRIYFPVVSKEIAENLELDSAVPSGGSATILLVDDEEFLCDIGSQILTRAGYTVLTTTNARDALDLYRNQRSDISLVLLDLIMPEMGGKECFQELVNINPQVRVILSSGFLSDGTTEEARVFGVRGLVEKPYNMRQLLGMVRDVLDED